MHVYLPRKAVRMNLAPGQERAITFRLNEVGERLLRRLRSFTGIVRLQMVRAGESAQARFVALRIADPRRR